MMPKVLAIALVLAACGGKGRPPRVDQDTAADTPAPRAPGVDFRHMTYRPDCTGGEPVTVVDGRFQRKGADDRLDFQVRKVARGDLDGDGSEDAAVFTWCDTGGSGKFSEVVPFLLQGARVVALDAVAGGDRADGGIADVWIDGHVLVVEQYSTGEGHGACCPAFVETARFVWTGAAFVEEGPRSRRQYR